MDQTIEYAILSANVYATSVNKPSLNITPENEILFNSDWKLIDNSVNDNTGFLARAYLNTANNDIIIAFAGTTFEENMKLLDWINGNIPGTLGHYLGEQVVDAARFYLDIIQTPEAADCQVSFTGHSPPPADPPPSAPAHRNTSRPHQRHRDYTRTHLRRESPTPPRSAVHGDSACRDVRAQLATLIDAAPRNAFIF
jgi:hypothetical protein